MRKLKKENQTKWNVRSLSAHCLGVQYGQPSIGTLGFGFDDLVPQTPSLSPKNIFL